MTRKTKDSRLREADRFAIRFITVLGLLAGGLSGLTCAPRLQRALRPFGVSSYELGPGLAIIAVFAVAGALVAWRLARRN